MPLCDNTYSEIGEYGTGVEYGASVCPEVIFTDVLTPARDLIQIDTTVEFVVNDLYLDTSNYTIIETNTGQALGVRKVLTPFNSPTSDSILLVVDKHVAGTEYSVTVANLLQRTGTVLAPRTGLFTAGNSKANSMLAATPDHFNSDPTTSVMRHVLQALAQSDDRIGGF